MAKNIKFMLDGCDITFVAEAPEDMTLKQLLDQCSRIEPDWCACGIRHLDEEEKKRLRTEILIDYNDIKKTAPDVSCTIHKNGDFIK